MLGSKGVEEALLNKGLAAVAPTRVVKGKKPVATTSFSKGRPPTAKG